MIDPKKIIYELREGVKKANPNLSEEEISAYVAGMIYGFSLARKFKEE